MLKKAFFKVFMVLVLFIGLASYGSYLTTGQMPFFSIKTWNKVKYTVANWAEALSPQNVVEQVQGESEQEPELVLFRWRDAEGGLHFGDAPPEDALELEMIRSSDLRPNTMPATEVLREEEIEEAEAEPVNPYTPEGVKEIMDKAKDAAKLLEQRQQQQQEALDQL